MTDLRLPKSLYKFFPAPLIAGVLGQARTRILLLYIVLMLLGTGLSVPVFEHLIFMQVSARVREDLSAAKNFFLEKYQREWESKNNQTFNGLVTFINRYLANYLPEDDNFVIIVLDGQLYDSDPVFLPKLMRPGSTLFQKWVQETNSTQGEWSSPDSETGTILYKVHPLTVKGERRGIFILAHATQGEQDEALAIVSVFVWVATGVVLISFLLAWFGTGWLLKPVRQLATTARAISDSELSQRIDVQGSGELAELAHTFNAMMDRVQKAFETQQQFVNDAGHELRTPITIIRGHLELMGDDPQEQQETIELVLDELDRMGRLVNDMIALAKAERPDYLQLEAIDLSELIQELFAKAQALAERRWQFSLRCTGVMVGDRQKLTGALLNLLKNAAQHTQPPDTIELGCSQASDHVKFWVKDTGIGIAPADQSRIFHRFARVAERQSDGFGLGLAIVKVIAEAHGGSIDLVSELGVGSTFTITLPCSSQTNTLSIEMPVHGVE